MSDNEMLEDIDVSPPPSQPSQGFNIANVLSTTGSGVSIAQDGPGIDYLNIDRKSDFSSDEATANANLKKLYPFVDQSVCYLIR